MALFTGDDLLDRPGVPDLDPVKADELARAAVVAIEAEVGPVEQRTSTIEVPGVWSHRLKIGRRPLTAVTSATIDGSAIDVDNLTVHRSGVIVRRRIGDTTFIGWTDVAGPHWGGPDVTVGLEIEHGWPRADVPEWLVDLAADLARRAATNPTGVTQESVGSYSVSYGDQGAAVRLTRVERMYLRRRFGLGVGHF